MESEGPLTRGQEKAEWLLRWVLFRSTTCNNRPKTTFTWQVEMIKKLHVNAGLYEMFILFVQLFLQFYKPQ